LEIAFWPTKSTFVDVKDQINCFGIKLAFYYFSPGFLCSKQHFFTHYLYYCINFGITLSSI